MRMGWTELFSTDSLKQNTCSRMKKTSDRVMEISNMLRLNLRFKSLLTLGRGNEINNGYQPFSVSGKQFI